MINLKWKSNFNSVFSFNDRLKILSNNPKGFCLIASTYGKVTHVCYGSINDIILKFKKMSKAPNGFNIAYYTYAEYASDNIKQVQDWIVESLYYNPNLELSRLNINLPCYCLFSNVIFNFKVFLSDEITIALAKFKQLEKKAQEHNLLDKIKCKLFYDKTPPEEYFAIVYTTDYFDKEIDFIKTFDIVDNYVLTENGCNIKNTLSVFGEIIDKRPIIYNTEKFE